MKINFDSFFKDIKKLVDSPARSDVKDPTAGDFREVLASISPRIGEKISQINQLPPESVTPRVQKESIDDSMGRFKLPSPTLLQEELQPLIPQEISSDSDSDSVKTPTIVSAKRVHARARYSGESHPERVEKVRKMVEQAGLEQGIDPALSMAIVAQESAFDHKAVSNDGFSSKGLFQLLDSTGHTLLQRASIDHPYNPFDPKQNVQLGVSYLRYLHEIFSNSTSLPNDLNTVPAANSSSLEKLAVAAFNAGEGRVASAQARAAKNGSDPSRYEDIAPYLPDSTRDYVMRVLRFKNEFEQKFFG